MTLIRYEGQVHFNNYYIDGMKCAFIRWFNLPLSLSQPGLYWYMRTGRGGFLDNFQIWGPCMDFTQYIHLNFNGNHAVYVTYVIIYIYCIKFKTHNKLNVANGMVPRAKANCYILFCILHTWNRFQYHY